MKRYKSVKNEKDKLDNDDSYDSNLGSMESAIHERDPFKEITKHVVNMARCIEDIADINQFDPSIALALMSAIPLQLLRDRHTPAAFQGMWCNTLDVTELDPGFLLKALLVMIIEKEGHELPRGVDIKIMKSDDMPPGFEEGVQADGYVNMIDILKTKKKPKPKPH